VWGHQGKKVKTIDLKKLEKQGYKRLKERAYKYSCIINPVFHQEIGTTIIHRNRKIGLGSNVGHCRGNPLCLP
jgi:hypothetical protein